MQTPWPRAGGGPDTYEGCCPALCRPGPVGGAHPGLGEVSYIFHVIIINNDNLPVVCLCLRW